MPQLLAHPATPNSRYSPYSFKEPKAKNAHVALPSAQSLAFVQELSQSPSLAGANNSPSAAYPSSSPPSFAQTFLKTSPGNSPRENEEKNHKPCHTFNSQRISDINTTLKHSLKRSVGERVHDSSYRVLSKALVTLLNQYQLEPHVANVVRSATIKNSVGGVTDEISISVKVEDLPEEDEELEEDEDFSDSEAERLPQSERDQVNIAVKFTYGR